MNGSLYWDSHKKKSRICRHTRAGICTVSTASAVVTGEVNCYNVIVRRRTSGSGPTERRPTERLLQTFNAGR